MKIFKQMIALAVIAGLGMLSGCSGAKTEAPAPAPKTEAPAPAPETPAAPAPAAPAAK